MNTQNILGGEVIIGKHVILGSGTTVIGKSNIGEGCSIGSKSLVRNDLDPWGIYVGSPCKRIKNRKKDLLLLEKKFLVENPD